MKMEQLETGEKIETQVTEDDKSRPKHTVGCTAHECHGAMMVKEGFGEIEVVAGRLAPLHLTTTCTPPHASRYTLRRPACVLRPRISPLAQDAYSVSKEQRLEEMAAFITQAGTRAPAPAAPRAPPYLSSQPTRRRQSPPTHPQFYKETRPTHDSLEERLAACTEAIEETGTYEVRLRGRGSRVWPGRAPAGGEFQSGDMLACGAGTACAHHHHGVPRRSICVSPPAHRQLNCPPVLPRLTE